MSKLLFVPFRAAGGFVSGMIGRRVFAGVWSLIDKHEPPDPKRRDAPWSKVLAALLLQGAIFSAARGIGDRAARAAFRKLTGSWPGEREASGERGTRD
ncbi:MAG TPA: DUF4235 domain-containing protein [Solirubrobacteraceae bacterium]|jgi:hypothetical protein|nr:DUF4235 domain-containing protein [Solirubrobacteraceae bacterium]